MKRFSLVIGLLSAAVLLVMFLAVGQSQTLPTTRHMDLIHFAGTDPIPGPNSIWHEIYPSYCDYYQQTGYGDNGDGIVSPCDWITLGDTRYHIVDVIPTYFFATEDGPLIFEGTIPYSDELKDPTCQTWIQVYPPEDYMRQVHVDRWVDGGDGSFNQCDDVEIEGVLLHVEGIGLDIVIGEEENPVERGTWGNIKSFFHQLIF